MTASIRELLTPAAAVRILELRAKARKERIDEIHRKGGKTILEAMREAAKKEKS